ncbi:MAG: glycosyltransferase [Eggerthellaceae bacterium]|nr:glycosyltransferase [Eggerthellaceae bacterium]
MDKLTQHHEHLKCYFENYAGCLNTEQPVFIDPHCLAASTANEFFLSGVFSFSIEEETFTELKVTADRFNTSPIVVITASEGQFEFKGNTYYYKEYALKFKGCPFYLSLKYGKARKFLRRSQLKKLIAEYYRRIENACCGDVYDEYWRLLSATKAESLGSNKAVQKQLNSQPKFSFVCPVYNPAPEHFQAMLDSVLCQTYKNFELILVNADSSNHEISKIISDHNSSKLKVVELDKNMGIAENTNKGIELARGDYVAFIDHDDCVESDLLEEYANAIDGSDVDLLYCDEDSITEEGRHILPIFKPDFNPDFLYSNNYILHCLCVSKAVLESTERTSSKYDGAQDYDLTLKAFEFSKNICHVPKVLYHWRMHEKSTNAGNLENKSYTNEAGRLAISDHFHRVGLKATVTEEDVPSTYKTLFQIDGDYTIDLLILGCSCSKLVNQVKVALPSNIKLVSTSFVYNPKELADSGKFQGDFSILIQGYEAYDLNDLDLLYLFGYFVRPEVALISPKCVSSLGLNTYAGIALKPDGGFNYLNRNLPENDGGYLGRAHRPMDHLLVNPDFFVMRNSVLHELGGFECNHESLEYTFADFFLKVHDKGFLSVFTPFCVFRDSGNASLLHYEPGELYPEDKKKFYEKYKFLLENGVSDFNINLNPNDNYYKLSRS